MPVTLTKLRAPSAVDEDAPQPYTAQQFRVLAATYPDLRMEMTKEGEIVIIPPAFSETGRKNADIVTQLGQWNARSRDGVIFDSSAGFTLPDGAKRSPDASWIIQARWQVLTQAQRDDFAPICPDFVVELRSRTDRLSMLRKKMGEYIANGARLGWLIDPRRRKVEVYRPGQEVETLDDPETVSGDPELAGFVLDLAGIWD